MPRTIYHHENNSSEEWVIVNDDGTVTHELENSGWPATKGGISNRKQTMTADEAKAKWPSHASAIDQAIASLHPNKT